MIGEQALQLETLMQSAALDPSQWQAALDALNAFVGASGVVLLTVDARGRFAPASTDIVDMIEDYFGGGWSANDRRDRCIPLLKTKGIVFDHEFQSVDEIVNCDFYQDFLARHNQKWFAGVSADVDGDSWCLAFQRSPEIGAFDQTDMARLTTVRSVLSNTARLARQVGRSWLSGLEQALEMMGHPALIFDNQARVLQLNSAAHVLLGDDLDGDKGLRFRSPQEQDAFDAMLKAALSPLRLLADGEAGTVVHVDGARYSCQATSLLGQEGLLATRVAALVVLKPLGRNRSTILRKRYALTDAEIKVATAIADGKSVKEIAALNRVTDGTVRAQLKSIFGKADVSSQSMLVSLIYNLDAD